VQVIPREHWVDSVSCAYVLFAANELTELAYFTLEYAGVWRRKRLNVPFPFPSPQCGRVSVPRGKLYIGESYAE